MPDSNKRPYILKQTEATYLNKLELLAAALLKDTLMQILKSPYMFLFK